VLVRRWQVVGQSYGGGAIYTPAAEQRATSSLVSGARQLRTAGASYVDSRSTVHHLAHAKPSNCSRSVYRVQTDASCRTSIVVECTGCCRASSLRAAEDVSSSQIVDRCSEVGLTMKRKFIVPFVVVEMCLMSLTATTSNHGRQCIMTAEDSWYQQSHLQSVVGLFDLFHHVRFIGL